MYEFSDSYLNVHDYFGPRRPFSIVGRKEEKIRLANEEQPEDGGDAEKNLLLSIL